MNVKAKVIFNKNFYYFDRVKLFILFKNKKKKKLLIKNYLKNISKMIVFKK
jgi:hypothetical protein